MLTYSIIATVAFLILLTVLIIVIKYKNNCIYDIQSYYEDEIEETHNKTNLEKQNMLKKLEEADSLLKDETNHKERLQQKIENTKCLLCGEASNAKHFCFSCYSKYKARSIDVRIEKCNNTEILDYYGNKTFVCDDGRMVRSRAEALISNFLFNNKIRYIYEKPVYYVENNENKTLHPDFFLPDYNLYIEYNELNEESYLQNKEYAMKIYQKEKLNVIVMTNKDLFDISSFLIPKLKAIKQN